MTNDNNGCYRNPFVCVCILLIIQLKPGIVSIYFLELHAYRHTHPPTHTHTPTHTYIRRPTVTRSPIPTHTHTQTQDQRWNTAIGIQQNTVGVCVHVFFIQKLDIISKEANATFWLKKRVLPSRPSVSE